MSIPSRLEALRNLMQTHQLDAYIIPSSDAHQSEYVADHWKVREWISGFTGSAGTVIVTPDHAGLWTDSRYFLQAEQELTNTGVTLHRLQVPHTPEHLNWLLEHLPKGSRIGLNGLQFSQQQFQQLQASLQSGNFNFWMEADLLDQIWTNRPALPMQPIFELSTDYVGQQRIEKIQAVRQFLEQQQAGAILLSALDEIAWLLNLRGADVDCNPVFYAFALVEKNQATLFVQAEKLEASLVKELEADGIYLQPYDAAYQLALDDQESIILSSGSINVPLYQQFDPAQILEADSPIQLAKAKKNKTEIAQIQEAMRKDGVALTRLYRWLEVQLATGASFTEADVAVQLNQYRAAQGNYFGESFAAIVGYRSNGAIIHYHPLPATAARIEPKGLLLIDSGGQYLEGTTDITRTTSLSPPSEIQKHHYTLVLKGNIQLDRAIFPKGTTGVQLDILARQALWQELLNYGHGTGHGVGHFLNVHEGPQSISPNPRSRAGYYPMESGMLTSNEPGLYLTEQYGIRIENLILCVPAGSSDFGEFLKFETLTLFPFDRQLINIELLNTEEINWINNYHQRVLRTLAPGLEPAEVAWLEEKCRPIE